MFICSKNNNSLFRDIGMEPSINRGRIRFSNEDTRDFFEHIGEPVPGFEYKWCFSNEFEYNIRKAAAYQKV